MSAILFDIGGTKTRITITKDTDFTVSKFDTPKDPKQFIETIKDTVADLDSKTKITAIAGGIRGRLNESKTALRDDSVLKKWLDFPLCEELTKAISVPAVLENDTAVAGLGEAVYGAGKEFDYVVYHTISTGVGGVKIEHGKVDEASLGFEPGHQILDIDRTVLGEDITPTLENLVSGTAIEERMGVKPYEIDQDDTLWDTLAGYLGQGLRNSILYWSPEIIVLGGSMIIGDPKILIEDIRKHTVAALDGFTEAPYITTAKLGDDAGLYGALALAKQNQYI